VRIQKVQALNNWYMGMTKGQKILVYVISCGLVPFFGIGLAPLALLLYLQLGMSGKSAG